jgi:hypothetical protein
MFFDRTGLYSWAFVQLWGKEERRAEKMAGRAPFKWQMVNTTV